MFVSPTRVCVVVYVVKEVTSFPGARSIPAKQMYVLRKELRKVCRGWMVQNTVCWGTHKEGWAYFHAMCPVRRVLGHVSPGKV